MNLNYLIVGGAALLGYFFFSIWRAKVTVSKHCRNEINKVLNSEEHKVKGRFE
jgi:hypothetical protein